MKRGLSVAGRLWLGFGLFFVMLLAACLVALAGLGRINGEIERMVEKDWKKVTLASDISFAANDVARTIFSMLHGTGQLAAQKQSIQKHRETVIERLDSIEKMLYKPKGKQLVAALREKREAFAATYPKVLALLEAGKKDEAAAFFTVNGMPQLDAYVQAVDEFVRFQGDLFNEGVAEAHATYADVRLLIVAFIAAAAVLAALLSAWIVRSVTRPLGGEPEDAKQAVQRIAEGDLSFEIALRPGDRDSLLAALSGMRDKLRQMLGNIQGDADGVSGAARSLSVSAAQLAASTLTQSEAAASMAAAVEEVTVNIGQVSDSANETHAITGQTGDLSTEGNGVILRTVDEMHAVAQAVETASQKIGEMGASSLQISSIVQVIRDVAEQTNLLALNAAIEAARAGEQGRGFAVVADEVRKLAERTARATTEIGTMIAAIQVEAQDAVAAMESTASRVNQGVLMAEQASASMVEIQKSSEQARARVNDIAGALHEQKTAGGELSANVERVAQMAEENSAATHEAADTAHRLEQLAASVHAALGYFRLASAMR